jgi:hypothetical protein
MKFLDGVIPKHDAPQSDEESLFWLFIVETTNRVLSEIQTR